MFFQNRVNDEKQNFGNSFDFLPKFVAISLRKIKYVKILLTFHNASIRIDSKQRIADLSAGNIKPPLRIADLSAGNTKCPLFPYYYWDSNHKCLRAFNRALY